MGTPRYAARASMCSCSRSPALTAGDTAGSAALLLDGDGRVLRWSGAVPELFGRPAEQVGDRGICDALLGGRHRRMIGEALAQVAAGGRWTGVLRAECGVHGRVRHLEFGFEPFRAMAAADLVLVTVTQVPVAGGGDPGAVAIRLALVNQASARIGATLDLGQTARDFLDVAVPRFADIGGVHALESMLRDEPVPAPAAGETVQVRRLAMSMATLRTERSDWSALFPAGEIAVCAPDSPFGRCVNGGSAVRFGLRELHALELDRIRSLVGEEGMRAALQASLLAVPLRARGVMLGLVAFVRAPGRPAFDDEDVAAAEALAAQAGMCIDNARLYERERRTAQALQQSLAPMDVTVPPGLEIAHRYLPAGRDRSVGGDWYDVIALARDRTALVIGDAMGHDAVAAAATGRLRVALRALSRLDLPPADLLRHLDQVTHDTDPEQCATCLYAVCDVRRRSCTVARAGHVPPILLHADGTTTVLDLPPGLPLGLGEDAFETTEVEIPDGATLVLYTDGLVESRHRDLEAGISRLRAVLARPGATPAEICDLVTAAFPHRNDDVTLLVVRMVGRSPMVVRPDEGPPAPAPEPGNPARWRTTGGDR